MVKGKHATPSLGMRMKANPFLPAAGGDAREREEILFDFLSTQAHSTTPEVWARYADEAGRRDDAGFFALLASNLVETAAPEAAHHLYEVATNLLGERLTVDDYGQWLRRGPVDVQRLAAYLDHSFVSAA